MTTPIAGPRWKDEIVAELQSLAQTGAGFWSCIEPDKFITPLGEAWSPSDNVRHLAKSTQPVVTALRLPRFVPALMFGRATGRSRDYAELAFAYDAALARGGKAGRFAPSKQPSFASAADFQRDVVARWAGIVTKLARIVEGWSESDLDTSRLPHPLLGKLTVREMLFFTLYHHEHHSNSVKRRLTDARRAAAAEPV